MTKCIVSIALLLICTSMGCATLQDTSFRVANHWRSQTAWWECKATVPACCNRHDYAHGFKYGYRKAAAGGPTCPPIVPPAYYWSVLHQSTRGQSDVNCWYQGFQAGVIAAEQDCRDVWADVPTLDGPGAGCVMNYDCPLPGCIDPSGDIPLETHSAKYK